MVLTILVTPLYSQSNSFKYIERLIEEKRLDSAFILLNTLKLNELSTYEQGKYHFNLGLVYKKKDLHHSGFDELLKAKFLFKQIDSVNIVANTNYEIYDLLTHQDDLNIDKTPFLNEFIAFNEATNDTLGLAQMYFGIGTIHLDNDDFINTLRFYRKSITELEKIKDTLRISSIENNVGIVYNTIGKNSDSALFYFKKSLPVFESKKYREYVSYNLNNQARAYENLNDYITAIEYYHKAEAIPLREYSAKTRLIYYDNLARVYQKNGDCENSLFYSTKYRNLKDSINDHAQNLAIAELGTEEFQIQIITLEREKEGYEATISKRNTQILASLGSGLSVLVISILIYRSTKRKQRIAEQERELEVQKTDKILAEQELKSLQAMIAGQAKERETVANDLHNSVASTLNAARFKFEHIKKNKDQLDQVDQEFFDHTLELLNQAHDEVRGMAHLKNSGVVATKGLLPALRNLAKMASGANGLQVNVEDFGLNERIDNSLEITIFSTVQELINNVIKHAQATEATISVTRHEDMLNIIVEDNGIGFDTQQAFGKSMGLKNLERQIEQQGGTLQLDSSPGKGTTAVIDLPYDPSGNRGRP